MSTGLNAQFGFKLEGTVGTPVTVDKFLPLTGEGIEFDPGWIEPNSLLVGTDTDLGSQLVQTRKQVSGSVSIDHYTRNMGALWKAALGSAVVTPTVVTGSAYKQVHQAVPLGVNGKALTLQVGRPEVTTGTTKPHTYSGVKVTGWEFNVSDNDVCKMSMNVDGWDEATATALATASYLSVERFDFSDCSVFTLGATIAGTTELTYSGGTAVTSIVKSLSLKAENSLATERYGLGNSGLKKEQVQNGKRVITGTLDAEYLQSEFYTPFKAGTATSLVVKFESSVISGTDKNTIEFIIPEIRIKKVTPKVEGPDIVMAQVEFQAYVNPAGQVPIQVKLISADSTAI